jgi:hypothetical protein
MATLSTNWPTLLDISKRLDPQGKISAVAEVLNQYNEILDDIPWIEGNLPTGHKTTLRGSLPTPTWRLFNSGVQPVKSTSNQITETCGMLENYSEVDKDLAMLNGNTAEWRLSEDKPIMEGMNQELGKTLIYGDTSINPEKFVGLAPRYYTVVLANSTAAVNVLDALGTGSDNTSVWLVGWSEDTVHGIYPKGSMAGLQVQDLGEQTIYDANNARYQAFRTHYQWKCGLAVRDYRYVVRIANVDVSDLLTAGDGTDTSTNLLKFMSRALDQMFSLSGVRPVFYMNNTVRAMLRVKLLNAKNVFLSLEDYKGAGGVPRPTLTFMGYPCRRIDQITNAEARVV